MATVVEILVKLIPVKGSTGPEQQDAVEFRYTGLNQAGKEALLNRAGDLNLRVVKSDVILRFVIDDDAISWGGGSTWKASLPTTGGDALWIFDNVLDKKPYADADKEFDGFKHPANYQRPAVEVTNRNKKLHIYDYALAVVLTPTGGGRPVTVRDDPQIKNGGLNIAATWTVPQRVLGLLLGLTSLLLAANLVVQIFGFGR